jgi:hypothetical protein
MFVPKLACILVVATDTGETRRRLCGSVTYLHIVSAPTMHRAIHRVGDARRAGTIG